MNETPKIAGRAIGTKGAAPPIGDMSTEELAMKAAALADRAGRHFRVGEPDAAHRCLQDVVDLAKLAMQQNENGEVSK